MPDLNTVFKPLSNTMCNNVLFSRLTIASMDKTMERLYAAVKEKTGIEGQSAVARLLNATPQTVKNWEARGVSKKGLLDAAAALGLSTVWLENGVGSMDGPDGLPSHFTLGSDENEDLEVGKIEYWNARGSCGGGFLNYEQLPKGHLVKEITFFKRYGLKPENAFAIYADGNSMADFIVDGDIVIFDKSKKEPASGRIFAIDHPDGLRIKMLRRDIDGSWILESNNIDKRAFPDERISPEQGALLKIHGQFVYRQGG